MQPTDGLGQVIELRSADVHYVLQGPLVGLVCALSYESPECYPRPMKGIFVAMIVMNCTFVSSGKLDMYKTESAT